MEGSMGHDRTQNKSNGCHDGVVVTVHTMETEFSTRTGENDEGHKIDSPESASVVTDISPNEEGKTGVEWPAEIEFFCRICNLSPSQGGPASSKLINLGCSCKGELGIAHRQCAEAWFWLKGERYCEICGANAKNIIGEEDHNFMQEWHDRSMSGNNSNRNMLNSSNFWKDQPFHYFLISCFVIFFMFPCFYNILIPQLN